MKERDRVAEPLYEVKSSRDLLVREISRHRGRIRKYYQSMLAEYDEKERKNSPDEINVKKV
jgi:hypothetical protein